MGNLRSLEEAYPEVVRRGRSLAALAPLRAACAMSGGYVLEVQGSGAQSYEVRVVLDAPTDASCLCPDYLTRGRPCKHVCGSFVALLSLEPGVLPLREPELAVVQTAEQGEGAFGTADLLRELRASEAEVARMRSVVAAGQAERARAVAAPTSQLAAGIRGLSAVESEQEWTRLSSEAVEFVYVACFTFDSSAIVLALEQARARGVLVKLVFSLQDKALTRNQAPRLQRMRACGCEIRAHRPGRLHAKVLLTDAGSVIGSTNFTEASQQNTERGVLIPASLAEFQQGEREWFEKIFSLAPKFLYGQGEALPATPQRYLPLGCLWRRAPVSSSFGRSSLQARFDVTSCCRSATHSQIE